MADSSINPLTGELFGAQPVVEKIDAKTDKSVPINPITGKAFSAPASTYSGNTSYIGGSKRKARNVSNESMTQHSVNLGEDISKFTDYNVPLGQDLDWQELRARNQSTSEKWGRGLAKAGVTTLGAVAENTIGVLFGLGELATGGAYYDNAIGKSIDKTNEWMREEMPNYLTAEEQKMSTLSKLGTANFWADTVASGLGYSIGSIATMWMTGGGGLITKGVSAAAKGLGIYRAAKAVINGTKLAQKLAKGGAGFARSAQMLEAGALMSLAEASVEARETQKSVYSDLVQDYMNENNLGSENEIGSDLLKDFEDVSYAAGNTNFVSQMPVLMGSNLLMFGKQVAGFKAASNVSKDVAWDLTAKKAISKLADQSVWRQALSRMKPTALGSLEEAAQEGFQYASGHFASSYHKDKHHNGGYGDMSKSLSESISETFGTQEGLESMFVGALTGGLMGSAQSTISGDYANRKTNADALAKFSNGGYLQNVEAKYQSANASAAAVERMDKYLKEGNIKKFKDEQFRLISFQALEALERGGFDVMMEKLNDAKGLDPGQFMEHFGYQTTDKSGNAITLEDQTGGKSQSEVIEGLKAKLENFKTVYDNVGTRFPLDDKTTGLPRMLMSEEARTAEDAVYAKQSALRAELIITGAEVKDRTNRMKSIKTGLGNIIDGSLAENAVGNANNTNAPVTDSEGLALKLDAATMNHSENNPGEMDADMFDANGQFDFVQKALHSTYLDLFASDPIAAERFHAEASDYLALLNENRVALDRYNKLSSDEYARNQFDIERVKAEDIAKKKAADLKVESAISDSKTAEGLKIAMPAEGYSTEAGAKANAKYKELKAAENKERDTFLKASLEDLEKLDREKLSEVEVEGLKSAIEIKKGQQEAATDKIKEEQRDEERAEEQELEQAHEDKQKEVEEAFRADNVGDVEIISENGRSFQIEGEEYTNVEVNPLDALSIDKDGNIIGVNLVDSQGNSVHFSGPETRVDALAYSIIMAESAVAEGNQELTKEEVIEKVEVFEEEIAVEISTVGDRGKHGIKDSGFIREEIHALERGLQEALEAFDQLRAYYIQEENATKDELKADPKLKALKRTVNSIRAQIGARKRILKARNVTFVPSSAEVLKVERDALDLVAAIEEDLAKAEADAAASAAEAEIAEKAAADAKASEDVDAYVNASKEYRILMKMVEEAKALISKLKRKINYHRKKLIRLENEKSNDLPGDAEQSAPETSGETEEQIDERKDTNTPKKPQAKKTDVNRVEYTKNGKTGIYYVSTDSDGQPQVFTAGSTTPTVFLKGQEKDRMKIIGKWHVQTGNALVIIHENKAFIVLYKGVTANGKTGIIQEDGTYVNADTVNDDIKKKVAYAAIIKKANDLHAKRVANTTTTESDAALKKGEETKEAVVSIKKSAVETKGTPGPTGGGIQKISKADLAELMGEEFESDPNMPSINKESLREFESEEGENILDEGDNVDDANRLDELFGPQPTLAEQLGKAKEKKEAQAPVEPEKPAIMNADDFVRGNTFEIKDSSSPLQQQAVDFMVADALKAGMDWKIGPNRSNVAGREVVEVIMPNGMTFLMYRSTGTGSSSDTKGLWVPIPGFARSGHFIKVHDTNGIDPKFSKYNVPLFKSVANTLESLDAEGKKILELEAGWKPAQALRDIVVPEMNVVEPNLNPTPKEKNTFGVKSASDAYVIMEDSVDMAGNPVRRSKLEVSENGTPRQHEPDTVDGVPIPMDKTLLSSSGPLFGREVTFEVIVNDYAKESPDRQTPFTVPIYYKLDGVIVGKLESGNSSERAELVDALQRGEEVTMEITDVIAGNFNHSRTSDGGKFFSNPAEVFDNPILVFTEVIEDMPQWTFGETSEDKGITDALHSDISTADNAGVDNGQVGIVVRGNRTPQGRARLSIASTADLAPVAQGVVMNLLKEGKFEQASEIIANSLYADSSKWANSFLQFGNFTNGAGFLVYKSPSTGDIIRITDANMKEAGKGKTYSADIVKLTADEQAFTKVKVVPDSVDVVEDITNFVKMKKYHVSRGLGNSAGAYTSQVTGKTYDSYQGYLFAEEEIGSERGIGKGHHSILTTDMVEMDGSLFHNPQIEFDAGNLKGTTVKGKLESPVRDVKGTTFSENPVEGMEGLNFGDNFKKDEMDQDCPF